MPLLQGRSVTLTGFSTLQKAMVGLEIGVEPTSGGIKRRTGTLTLSTDKWDIFTQTAIPTGVRLIDIDARYQSYLSPGIEIPIALPWGAHPLGPVVIANWPDPPSVTKPTVTVQLTCILGFFAASNPPDDDKSGVTGGTDEDFAAVARRLLIAGGIPSNRISLANSWGYQLCQPIAKEGGSYVGQAGAIAEAAGRVLYVDSAGVVRDAKPNFFAAQTKLFVLGRDEAIAEPVSSPEAPAQTCKVVAAGKGCGTTPSNPSVVQSDIVGPVEGIIPNASGNSLIVGTIVTTTTDDQPGYVRVTKETLTRRLAGAVSPRINPASQTMIAERVTERREYDANRRLEFVEIVTRTPRVVIDPDVESLLTFEAESNKLWINYYYNAKDVVIEIATRQWSARKAVYSDATQPFDPVPSGRKVEQWIPLEQEGKYHYVLMDLKPMAQVKPEGIEDEDDAYRLMSDPRQQPPDPTTPPPATEYYQGPADQAPEQHFEGKSEFSYPYPATLEQDRHRTWQISPGVSNAQCQEVADIKGKLLWGSRFGINLEVAQDSTLAALDAPYWRFDVQTPAVPRPGGGTPLEPETTSAYLCDSVVWSHGRDDGDRVHLYGIYLGEGTGGSITPPYGTVRSLTIAGRGRVTATDTTPPRVTFASLSVVGRGKVTAEIFTAISGGNQQEVHTSTWIFGTTPPTTFTPSGGSAITLAPGMVFHFSGDPGISGITQAEVTYGVVASGGGLGWVLLTASTYGDTPEPSLPNDTAQTAQVEHIEVQNTHGTETFIYKRRVNNVWKQFASTN